MQKPFLYATALLLLAGCSKDKSSPRADFTGQVQLVDEFGNNQTAGSGVQVTTTDVTVPNGAQATVQTGSDGTYSANSTSNFGNQLTFSKSGYASAQSDILVRDVSSVVSVPTIILSPVSSTVATISQILKTGRQLTVIGSVSPAPTASQPRPHRLYFQRATASGIKQPIGLNYELSVARTTQPDGTFADVITEQELSTAGYNSIGDIRVWATGDNPKATTYLDLTYNRQAYPAAVPIVANYKTVLY